MNDETTRENERTSGGAASEGAATVTAEAASAGARAGATPGPASAGASGGAAAPGAQTAAEKSKGRSPWLFVLRDVSIALAVLSLFAAADAWYLATGGLPAAAVFSVLVALPVGTVLALFIHEWGHYIGGLLSGSHMQLGPVSGPPLFNFDFEKNTQGQFQWMSAGGNIAPWLFAGLFVAAVGVENPGRLALVSAVVGAIVFFHTTEFPVIWRTANGMAPRQSLGKLTIPTLKRNGVIGAFVAVAMLFAFSL